MEKKPKTQQAEAPLLIVYPKELTYYVDTEHTYVHANIQCFMLYKDGLVRMLVQTKDRFGSFHNGLSILHVNKDTFEKHTGIDLDNVEIEEIPLIKKPLTWDLVAVILVPALAAIVGTQNNFILGLLAITQIVLLLRLVLVSVMDKNRTQN